MASTIMLTRIAMCIIPLTSAFVPQLINRGKETNNDGVELFIFYGDEADITDYPFYAALDNCGAAILSPYWVLTAAHCVYQRHHESLWVGGETYSTSEKVRINHTIAHPTYNSEELLDDIALINLEKPLTLTQKIQPVLLPQSKELEEVQYEPYVFIGRGESETFAVDEHLQKSKMEVFSVSRCYSHYHIERYILDSTLAERNKKVICTVREKHLPGVCNGDSGSPLVQRNVLIGLGSYMIAKAGTCTAPDSYLVNVKYYLPWIKNVTGLE